MKNSQKVAFSADIGGTFTDIVVEVGKERFSTKVLTTHSAPEEGVLQGVEKLLQSASIKAEDVDVFVHGTTLATNAILERKGARTALITTQGFRDSIEIGYENRFDQYDLFIDKPEPLVPRSMRHTVPERLSVHGEVLKPLDMDAVELVCDQMIEAGVESVAIGLLHSYVNSAHEQAVRKAVQARMPEVNITVSSEVCPEAREYERFSTACANAYVQPVIGTYLRRLQRRLEDMGFNCPLLMMGSGGGLMTVDTAVAYPIRLVESGPAGGAILAAYVAQQSDFDRILSFDMGGTTAKVCLIDGGQPHLSRDFEVDRQYRFLKGSGIPLRIPVIDMVEIGAGGGSIAAADKLGRIVVGPQSAGSEPGPACYDRGGSEPTVTDANLVLGRLDPDAFAGGSFSLNTGNALAAMGTKLGDFLGLSALVASYGVSEVVEENMANAARVHAIDRGIDLTDRTLVAFGGAAPLHASKLAEKLGIGRVVIPRNAGVGSAVGFLRAPIAFQVVRSGLMKVSAFSRQHLEAIFDSMLEEARGIVRQGAPGREILQRRQLDMRYCGQGHEIAVVLPSGGTSPLDADSIRKLFDEEYLRQYSRSIPEIDIEITGYTLLVTAEQDPIEKGNKLTVSRSAAPVSGTRELFDRMKGDFISVPFYDRMTLSPGHAMEGPAVIIEDETTTIVASGFDAEIDEFYSIVLSRKT